MASQLWEVRVNALKIVMCLMAFWMSVMLLAFAKSFSFLIFKFLEVL